MPARKRSELETFMVELTALCQKHGFSIGGCGCCGSPWVEKASGKLVWSVESPGHGWLGSELRVDVAEDVDKPGLISPEIKNAS